MSTVRCLNCWKPLARITHQVWRISLNYYILFDDPAKARQIERDGTEPPFRPACSFIAKMACRLQLTVYSVFYREMRAGVASLTLVHRDKIDRDQEGLGCGSASLLAVGRATNAVRAGFHA